MNKTRTIFLASLIFGLGFINQLVQNKINVNAKTSHDHNDIEFADVLFGNEQSLITGKYFLNSDITLTSNITINDGSEITICLNDHILDLSTYNFSLSNGSTLEFVDCGNTLRGFEKNNQGVYQEISPGAETISTRGGYIKGISGGFNLEDNSTLSFEDIEIECISDANSLINATSSNISLINSRIQGNMFKDNLMNLDDCDVSIINSYICNNQINNGIVLSNTSSITLNRAYITNNNILQKKDDNIAALVANNSSIDLSLQTTIKNNTIKFGLSDLESNLYDGLNNTITSSTNDFVGEVGIESKNNNCFISSIYKNFFFASNLNNVIVEENSKIKLANIIDITSQANATNDFEVSYTNLNGVSDINYNWYYVGENNDVLTSNTTKKLTSVSNKGKYYLEISYVYDSINRKVFSNYVNAYELTFDVLEGIGSIDSIINLEGKSIVLPSNINVTKENYKPSTYNTEDDGTGTKYELSANYILSNDATLYLMYTKNVSIKKDAQEYTYDGEEKQFNIINATDSITGFNVSYYIDEAWTNTKPTHSGTYDVLITRNKDDNYSYFEEEITGGLVINKASIDLSNIKYNDTSYSYTGSPISLLITGTLSSLVSVSYTNNTLTEVGSIEATATFNASSDYVLSITSLTATLTITPIKVSVNWDEDNYSYNGNVQTIQAYFYDLSYSLVYFDVSTDKEFKNAGSYIATANFKNATTHYVIDGSNTKNYTIKKIDYNMNNIIYSNATYTYDGLNKEIVITGSLPEGVSVSYENNSSTDVCNLKATAKFTGDENHNPINDLEATLIINPYVVDINWQANNFSYNGTIQTITATYKDIYNKDIELEVICNSEFKNAGSYPVLASFKNNETNYILPSNKSNTYTMAKISYDISSIEVKDTTITYDGKDHGVDVIGTLPTGIDGIKLSYRYENTFKNVSTNVIAVLFETDSTNYEIPDKIQATLTIEPKVIDIIWSSNDYTYNKNTQIVSAYYVTCYNQNVELLVNTNKEFKNAGKYIATASFKTSDDNYILPTINTTEYEIKKANYDVSKITWNYQEAFVYNGDYHQIEVVNLIEGISVKEYVDNRKIDAGEYIASVRFNYDEENYNEPIINNNNWKILKATFNMDNVSWDYTNPFTYNGENKEVKLLNLHQDLTPVYTNNTAKNAGNYKASVSFTFNENNYYPVEFNGIDWTINKAEYDLSSFTFTNKEIVYDGLKHIIEIEGSLPIGADNISLKVRYLGDATNISETTIIARFSTNSTNYNTPLDMRAKLTILPREIEVIWDENDFDYNGKIQEIKAYYLDAFNEIVYLDVTTNKEFKLPGDYVASISFANSEVNYLLPSITSKNYHMKKNTLFTEEFYGKVFLVNNNGIPYGISIQIVENNKELKTINSNTYSNEIIKKNRFEQIYASYDIKLLQSGHTISLEEISEIDNLVLKIKLDEFLLDGNFKFLHVHSADDYEILKYSTNLEDGGYYIEDGYLITKITNLSEFSFVVNKDYPTQYFFIGIIVAYILFISLIFKKHRFGFTFFIGSLVFAGLSFILIYFTNNMLSMLLSMADLAIIVVSIFLLLFNKLLFKRLK